MTLCSGVYHFFDATGRTDHLAAMFASLADSSLQSFPSGHRYSHTRTMKLPLGSSVLKHYKEANYVCRIKAEKSD